MNRRNSNKINNRQRVIIIILSFSFFTFLIASLLIALVYPQLLNKVIDYAADFCKVTLGAVLGWLLHRGRGP
jgi:uncharacterized membrane protein YraQ (UPF0718 family)